MRAILEPTAGDPASDAAQPPGELTLSVGEERTLDLPSLAGGGYVWEATAEDEAVATVSTAFVGADEATVGQKAFSRHELLTLQGVGVGKTEVRLVQRRAWESGVEPVAAHSLTVNVVDETTEQGGVK